MQEVSTARLFLLRATYLLTVVGSALRSGSAWSTCGRRLEPAGGRLATGPYRRWREPESSPTSLSSSLRETLRKKRSARACAGRSVSFFSYEN
jgi:hypothetical protein